MIRPLLSALLCLAATTSAQATLLAVDGDARTPGQSRLLYRENHLIRQHADRPLERLVLYRCPDGKAFARKHVDYRASTLAPDFELVDARGHREGLRRDGERMMIWSGTDAARPLARATDLLVVDAGFDEYLRQHWSAATSGRPQPIAFAIPAYGRSLAFRVRGSTQAASPKVEDRRHRFELRLDGLLGRLAPAIRIDYDDARRLRRFVGPTNIRDADGEPVQAEIVFPDAPRTVDPARWHALAREPLVACALGR